MEMPKVPDLPSSTFALKNNVAGILGFVAGAALVGGPLGIIGGLVVGGLVDHYYVRMRSCR